MCQQNYEENSTTFTTTALTSTIGTDTAATAAAATTTTTTTSYPTIPPTSNQNDITFTTTTFNKRTKQKLPNIVIALLDDVGWADLKGYHNNVDSLGATVPIMNSLWKEGVKLKSFYTQQICSPTRGALMTGRYPIRWRGHHSVATQIHKTWVPKDEEFLSELLKEIGYNTVAIGKWHLGHGSLKYSPIGRGFNQFLGPYSGAGDHYQHTISGMHKKKICSTSSMYCIQC